MSSSNSRLHSSVSALATQISAGEPPSLFPTGVDSKCEIINSLLGLDVRPSQKSIRALDYNTYLSYYVEQCKIALFDGGRHISAISFKDIIEIVAQIRSRVDRKATERWLHSKLPSPERDDQEKVNGAIDLAARLVSMTNVGELQFGFSGQERLHWVENSLHKCIQDYFDAPRMLGSERVKLERGFNARNLGRIGGIKIQFTNNLADHLRLSEDDMKVAIFHHVGFLISQQRR